MNKVVEILKSLSEPTRLRALMAVANGEICLCQITKLLKLAPSTISKHMSILKHAGLVKSRKEGRWIFYSITEDIDKNEDKYIAYTTIQRLRKDNEIIKDITNINRILRIEKEILCKK